MIVVTGANGFIGSNIVKSLSALVKNNIVSVDKDESFDTRNYLIGLPNNTFISNENITSFIHSNAINISHVIIMSGNSNTMEVDRVSLYKDNYLFPKKLIDICLGHNIKVVYASSASVYKYNYRNNIRSEKATSKYSKSKLMLDNYVRKYCFEKGNIIGLRFFNVYGINECHKGTMSSMIYRMTKQYITSGTISLFKNYNNSEHGGQSRDFVSVNCVSDVVLKLIFHGGVNDIYDIGTGSSIQFNRLASIIYSVFHEISESNVSSEILHKKGIIKYIEIPNDVANHYQPYTKANVNLSQFNEIKVDTSISHITKYIKNIINTHSDKCGGELIDKVILSA